MLVKKSNFTKERLTMSINATKTLPSLPKTISLKIHGQFIYFTAELIDNQTINLDYYRYQSNEEFWTDLTSRQRNYILFNLPKQVNTINHFVQRGGKIEIDHQNVTKSLLANQVKTPDEAIMQSVNSQMQTLTQTIKSYQWQITTHHKVMTLTNAKNTIKATVDQTKVPYTLTINNTATINDPQSLYGLSQLAKAVAKINNKLSQRMQ